MFTFNHVGELWPKPYLIQAVRWLNADFSIIVAVSVGEFEFLKTIFTVKVMIL